MLRLQEIALAGLYRGGFFDRAAFYGGTCLRVFHGLQRFSEDLDFSLLQADANFSLDHIFGLFRMNLRPLVLMSRSLLKRKVCQVILSRHF